MSCQCLVVLNPRICTDSNSRTINESLEEFFLWARVNVHLLTARILEPLCAGNLTFADWKSGFEEMSLA